MQHTFNSIKEVIHHYSERVISFDITQINELKDVARELKLEAILEEEAVDDNLYELQTPQQSLKVSNAGKII